MRILFIALLILITSCTTGVPMSSVKYDNLLHDGNSKVWLIDKMIVDETNVSMHNDWQKELLIFFDNGHVQYLPVQELGHKKGNIGEFSLDSEDRTISLYFDNATWKFSLTEISEDSLFMQPIKESDAQFSLHLIPLPEINFETTP